MSERPAAERDQLDDRVIEPLLEVRSVVTGVPHLLEGILGIRRLPLPPAIAPQQPRPVPVTGHVSFEDLARRTPDHFRYVIERRLRECLESLRTVLSKLWFQLESGGGRRASREVADLAIDVLAAANMINGRLSLEEEIASAADPRRIAVMGDGLIRVTRAVGVALRPLDQVAARLRQRTSKPNDDPRADPKRLVPDLGQAAAAVYSVLPEDGSPLLRAEIIRLSGYRERAVSNHLRTLRDRGLVASPRRGYWRRS